MSNSPTLGSWVIRGYQLNIAVEDEAPLLKQNSSIAKVLCHLSAVGDEDDRGSIVFEPTHSVE